MFCSSRVGDLWPYQLIAAACSLPAPIQIIGCMFSAPCACTNAFASHADSMKEPGSRTTCLCEWAGAGSAGRPCVRHVSLLQQFLGIFPVATVAFILIHLRPELEA